MKKFALIPAKSRSTRLPGKNIKEIGGVPMVVRVIKNLKDSELFDEIWVSTDGEDIARICLEEGAKIHNRPNNLAEDRSTINDVCVHWLNSLPEKPDVFCCAYATSVFLKPSDYQNAFKKLKPPFLGVMGVSEFNYPPVQAMAIDDIGNLEMLMPEYKSIQSQFYPECFVSNGSQYWLETKAYLVQKTFYVDNLAAYVTNEDRVLDINTQSDFNKAIDRAKELLD